MWLLAVLPACTEPDVDAGSSAPARGPAPVPSATPDTRRTALESAPQPTEEPTPEDSPCPREMVWVQGEYCPQVRQNCLEHHPEYLARRGEKTVSERCLRYEEPSTCLVSRRPASFCMDRFEYPNLEGELPRVLTSWTEAKRLCEAAGKRLCSEDEFNFACEGPELLPYATGSRRDPELCNIDRPYRWPDHSRRMKTYESCAEDEWCAGELARLDQRHRIGERMTCVSWAGVIDLNGNVNEWVVRPNQSYPDRSGLKGGWWGPVRNRCRPTVVFHKEHDYGYEAGFRCCKDAALNPGEDEL